MNEKIIGTIEIHKKNSSTPVKSIFESKVYFETGYPFLVANDGTFIIHPTKEGEDASGFTFFKQMLENGLKSQIT